MTGEFQVIVAHATEDQAFSSRAMDNTNLIICMPNVALLPGMLQWFQHLGPNLGILLCLSIVCSPACRHLWDRERAGAERQLRCHPLLVHPLPSALAPIVHRWPGTLLHISLPGVFAAHENACFSITLSDWNQQNICPIRYRSAKVKADMTALLRVVPANMIISGMDWSCASAAPSERMATLQ